MNGFFFTDGRGSTFPFEIARFRSTRFVRPSKVPTNNFVRHTERVVLVDGRKATSESKRPSLYARFVHSPPERGTIVGRQTT